MAECLSSPPIPSEREASDGAGGGNRTHTGLLSPQDFKSCASANFATPAYVCYQLLSGACSLLRRCRAAHCARYCARGVVDPRRCLSKGARINDGISAVHRLSFVADHLHGCGPRDPDLFEVPDSRAPEVMRDAARKTGGSTGGLPRSPYALDLPSVSMKDEGHDAVLLLQPLVLRELRLEEGLKCGREGKLPAFPV